MQGIFLIYSIIPIGIYSTIINLNIVLLIIGIFNIIFSLTLFIFVRRVGKSENIKMYPLSVLKLHYKEFSMEFNSEIKEIIGDTERKWNNNNVDYLGGDDSKKV